MAVSAALPGRGAALVLAAGFLLAGCGTKAASAPQAVPPSVPPPAPPSATGAAALDPCALLGSADRSSAGLTSVGKPKTIGAARACDWTETGMFGVTVTVDDTAGVRELKVADPKALKIGRHPATKSSGNGECAVLLPSGEKSSVQVDVTNSSFRETDLACRRATTVAQLIEPKLP